MQCSKWMCFGAITVLGTFFYVFTLQTLLKKLPKNVIKKQSKKKSVNDRKEFSMSTKHLAASFSDEIHRTFSSKNLPSGNINGEVELKEKPRSFQNINENEIGPKDEKSNYFLHELSQEEPYRSRILGIHDRCAKMPYYKYSKLDLTRYVYDDTHKTIFCVVPKNACSTMKKMLYLLMYNEGTDAEKVPWPYINLVENNSKLKTLAKLSPKESKTRLETYTKFMVQRHPLERLVSAYVDKMVDNKFDTNKELAKKLSREVIMQIYPRFRFDLNISAYAEARRLQSKEEQQLKEIVSFYERSSMTFKTFLLSLTARMRYRHMFNIHWRPQIELCNPCATNYDFIINFESLADDAEKLFSYLQRNDNKTFQEKLHFQKQERIPTNETKTQKMFKTIDEDLLKKIKRVYEKDFELFNIDPDNV